MCEDEITTVSRNVGHQWHGATCQKNEDLNCIAVEAEKIRHERLGHTEYPELL
jgi:hypothetical protein